ncbi:MAG: energy transducer TonB [Bacteroidales bacterium]
MKRITLISLFISLIVSLSLLNAQVPKISYNSTEDTPPVPNSINVKEEIPQIVFADPEYFPEYPGGEKALSLFIEKNAQCPKDSLPKDKIPLVICRFAVEKDGSITQLSILQKLAPAFDQEVIRIIKLMPKWKPAKHNGVLIISWYTLPIRFDKPICKKIK